MLYNNMIVDGTYQVMREIGSGGMGIIYLAYHLRLQKYIVLKKIKNPYADISMLRNEVDILKSLHHPYLPQVYDFIEFEGDLYTVIDYIDGYDLNYYIQNGYVFSESQLIKWLKQICDVLEYLHTRNPRILHTDIKPSNIIISTGGDVCLIDFGISLYNTDVIKGLSEHYSSPEQFGNFQYLQYGTGVYNQLDECSDIYSVGATFYHLMTGIQPDVVNGQPPVTEVNYGYSEALASIIARSMEVDTARRFQSADQMRKAIDNIKKQDVRYKKYILVQVLSSVLSVVLIIAGVLMVVNGNTQAVRTQYETDYNNFITAAQMGDGNTAIKNGQVLLSNREYQHLLSMETKSQILHKMGEMYFDTGDYLNAAYYYQSALDYEKSDANYRDYIIALIRDNRADEARQIISKIKSDFPDSVVIVVADAQLCYNNKDYQTAANTIESVKNRLMQNAENAYTGFIIAGDSYQALGNYSSAIESYRVAADNKETPAVLRKLGNAYMRSADKTSNTSMYLGAKECFQKIYDNYNATSDDIVNLSQSYMMLGDVSKYGECKQILLDVLSEKEDCRVYMMLAVVADATLDANTEQYCRKAHELYRLLSDDDKMYISSRTIQNMKQLYRKYCNIDW